MRIIEFSPWQCLCFEFNFNSRESKQILIAFYSKIKFSSKNKQAKNIFYLKSNFSQVSVIALSG